LTFKTKADGGYISMLFVFTLFTGLFIYLCIVSFNIRNLIICVVFLATELFFILPMYFKTRFTMQEDGLAIQVGWFVNRKVSYTSVFAYQQTEQEAKIAYGLSSQRIAIYIINEKGKNDVFTVSPKDRQGFMEALFEKTGIAVTPPEPTFREIQDEYNKKTSPEQRKTARRQLWSVISKGYDKDHIKPESPESFKEKAERQNSAKRNA